MENFNDNIIYIKEENNCLEENVKEEVDYKDYDKGEDLYYGNKKILNMEEHKKNKVKLTDHKDTNICKDVGIIKEELNSLDYNVQRTFEDSLNENNMSSSFKSKNMFQIKNCTNQQKSSDSIVVFSDGMTQHENLYTNSNLNECSEGSVSRSRNNKKNVKINSKHQSRKLFKCTKCNVFISHKSQIESHIKSHEVESFKSSEDALLKTYVNDIKSDDIIEQSFKDANSDFTKSKKSRLKMQSPKSEKVTFKCDYCEYNSSEKSKLRDHTRIHTGEKPFKCDFCDYCATQKSVLTTHLRIHTGDKPYRCDLCDYTSAAKSSLRYHIRNHTGEKKHRCTICDFSFARKANLENHLRIHTGERPYGCAYCDYRTKQKSSLRVHIKIHTGEKPFGCDYCEYKASRKTHLKRHIKIHKVIPGEKIGTELT